MLRENGSEWLIPTDDWIDATLDLAAEVAADPGVSLDDALAAFAEARAPGTPA